MPDCLPGLKPETNTGQARPSTSAKPSTSVVAQSLPSDKTQVSKKNCSIIQFMNCMLYHKMKPHNELTIL
jgi:hypothetical protein